jgi:hypothetical protein
MRRPFLSALLLAAGCHRAVPSMPSPVALKEEHCWWAVFHTPLPADTVAARFAQAFTTIGFTGARSGHLADTAWASAGPTELGGRWGGATYAARVVAYRQSDTTRFRHFLAAGLPAQAAADDTARMSGRLIGLCGELGRASATHGTAPRAPNGEETLGVWKRYPKN